MKTQDLRFNKKFILAIFFFIRRFCSRDGMVYLIF
jgi:hypothetical protein